MQHDSKIFKAYGSNLSRINNDWHIYLKKPFKDAIINLFIIFITQFAIFTKTSQPYFNKNNN